MTRRRLDGYLVLDRKDQYWLTGFSGEDGAALVTHRNVVLLTDGRFGETAEREAPWARKVIRRKRTADETAIQVKRERVSRLGFDPAHMPVAQFVALGAALRTGKLVSAAGIVRELRQIKTPAEVDAIRSAIRIAEQALLAARSWIRPGRTEQEVAARLAYEMQRRGAESPAFPSIVASGASGSLPHYTPGRAKLRAGDALLIDWGARASWYVSDLTRVLRVDSIPPRLRRVHQLVREAHDAAIAAVRPGVSAAQVDRAARRVIRKAGFGKQFVHSVGHGIGLDVHEGPRLGAQSKDVLAPGMVVTIEPGIYLPGVGGVRIEDDVLVTPTGHEVLSSLPTDWL